MPAYRMAIWLCLALGGLQGTMAEPAPAGEGCLRLAYDANLAKAGPVLQPYFERAYDGIGLCIDITPMPPKRAQNMLLSGELDGDLFRVREFGEQNPEAAILLPKPILAFEAQLVWLQGNGFSGNPADLKDQVVGYSAGIVWVEHQLAERNLVGLALPPGADMVGLLEHGRISVFVSYGTLTADIKRTGRRPRLKAALWRRVPVYHALHPRHADIAGSLNAALLEALDSPEGQAVLNLPGIDRVPPQLQDEGPAVPHEDP